jgi:hypothetical protein
MPASCSVYGGSMLILKVKTINIHGKKRILKKEVTTETKKAILFFAYNQIIRVTKNKS